MNVEVFKERDVLPRVLNYTASPCTATRKLPIPAHNGQTTEQPEVDLPTKTKNAGLVHQTDVRDPGPVIVGLVASHQGARPPAGPDLVLDLLGAAGTSHALDRGLGLLGAIVPVPALVTSAGAHDKEERRRDKKERKREKRERKDKKKHKGKSGAVTGQWGQHGIINESHMYEKDAEFRTWLVEECKINPESLSKDATKKQFARFVEDYNTATLPHPKFYNMESYERQMNSLRNGMTADVITNSYDPNADLAAHTSRHKRPVAEAETYLSREQLQELRKVQNERTQAGQMKLLGMDIKGTMGVRMDGSEFE
ncbi:hypothetical protein BN14_08719 [Rhizoctonia solani AG-1 IB]|uniref:Uncharacterized protein n=1 Tax=Thanatephorus cucumeris (strain AG1-IB / isolate 7/3/14) TaxID=1108050 RepID=M5C6C5_THACB|nr:hypothetical protein BN14_08719 [Rhizoctonia solani AG-1 IB]